MAKDFFIKFYNYNVTSSASYKSFSLFCKINLNCPILKGLQTNLQYWKLLQKISREPCKSICSLFCQFNPSPVVSDSFFLCLFSRLDYMYFCFISMFVNYFETGTLKFYFFRWYLQFGYQGYQTWRCWHLPSRIHQQGWWKESWSRP